MYAFNIVIVVAKGFLELGVIIVADFDGTVLDAKGVLRIFAEFLVADFRRPAIEIFSVEELDPLAFAGGFGFFRVRGGQ